MTLTLEEFLELRENKLTLSWMKKHNVPFLHHENMATAYLKQANQEEYDKAYTKIIGITTPDEDVHKHGGKMEK